MDKDVRIAQLEAEVAELKRLLTAALDENARLKRTSGKEKGTVPFFVSFGEPQATEDS